jgi:hypothetical protein
VTASHQSFVSIENAMTYHRILLIVFVIATSVLSPTGVTLKGDEPSLSFLRDIRPILAKACFHCHGPDEETREADLRLDSPDGVFGTVDDRQIVSKGHAHQSELVRRILTADSNLQMPPADSGKTLTDLQKQMLVRWIDSGAEWEQHWAFVPPGRPSVPIAIEEIRAIGGNEIDAFLEYRRRQAGLSAAPEGAPETLLRRAFLDLIGLQPTIAEIDHWLPQIACGPLSDTSPASKTSTAGWTELVDHLLSRPEYGERWARYWLDLARYADTNGYEKDRPRSIWPYRDWVIRSFNQDVPFDQFTIAQLAGDMLPNATLDQQIATGFHRNTMLNEEGGIDPLEFRFHAMTDRVATTGTTWLGLTVGCAQCHTHKYDPLTHRDYYQIMAYLNNADEPSMAVPQPEADRLKQQRHQEIRRLVAELPNHWDETSTQRGEQKTPDQGFAEWLNMQRQSAVPWTSLIPTAATSNLPNLTIEDEGVIFASGDTTKQDWYEITLAPSAKPIIALRLEALPDARLPGNGPGTTYYEGRLGDFYLNELSVSLEGEPVTFQSATESYAKNRFGNTPVSAALTIDGDVQSGWSIAEREGERHTAVYIPERPIPAGVPLTVRMNFGRHFASSLGKFRFASTDAAAPPAARDLPSEVETLLLLPDEQLNDVQRSVLLEQFLMTAPQLSNWTQKIRDLSRKTADATTLVMRERSQSFTRPTHRHHRGEYLLVREAVTPGTPEFLHSWPENVKRDRLGFAHWLTDRRNPLTARVFVNRQWAALFGRGIVETLDDFGVQGSLPEHPELLDWLAVTWMDEDRWSVKSLHRRIVLSSAYRMASVTSDEREMQRRRLDPENRLLSVAPRFRLDAEVIRDSILMASGVLSRKLGGPPVRPLQPQGITEVAFGSPPWEVSAGEDRFRRSIYTFIKRTAPFAMVTTFDGPTGEACIARRNRSNTPLQALTLMNDPMFLELSRKSGERLIALKSDDESAIRNLFRSTLTRHPDPEELRTLLTFLNETRLLYAREEGLARQLMGTEFQTQDDAQLIQAAAFTAISRAVFSLDEVVMRP